MILLSTDLLSRVKKREANYCLPLHITGYIYSLLSKKRFQTGVNHQAKTGTYL